MKTVQWILIGCRIVALTCGLAALGMGSGCGDSSQTTIGPKLSQEEEKRNEETRNAMEAASKAAQAKKK